MSAGAVALEKVMTERQNVNKRVTVTVIYCTEPNIMRNS